MKNIAEIFKKLYPPDRPELLRSLHRNLLKSWKFKAETVWIATTGYDFADWLSNPCSTVRNDFEEGED